MAGRLFGVYVAPAMRRLLVVAAVCAGCSSPPGANVEADGASDGPAIEAAADASLANDAAAADAGADVDPNACFESTGVWGECMTLSDCAALGAYSSSPGYCPGSSDIQCCAPTPNVADNPPVPAGWKLMSQSAVTPAMTSWAVAILHDPTDYPMFSTTTQTFGSLLVMARVEWHPPDFQNNTVHRGVTLYQPI